MASTVVYKLIPLLSLEIEDRARVLQIQFLHIRKSNMSSDASSLQDVEWLFFDVFGTVADCEHRPHLNKRDLPPDPLDSQGRAIPRQLCVGFPKRSIPRPTRHIPSRMTRSGWIVLRNGGLGS